MELGWRVLSLSYRQSTWLFRVPVANGRARCTWRCGPYGIVCGSLSVDDCQWAWPVCRHRNVTYDVFGASKLHYTRLLLSIATIKPMSYSLCAACPNRRHRNVFAMQAADHAVHEYAGSMLSFVVSLNVDDGPWAWHVGRHPSVAHDVFGVS